jgi:hypothetical protein
MMSKLINTFGVEIKIERPTSAGAKLTVTEASPELLGLSTNKTLGGGCGGFSLRLRPTLGATHPLAKGQRVLTAIALPLWLPSLRHSRPSMRIS